MADVVLERVTKRFGRQVAVRGLDLHVQDGEFMVLVGPSGCGKSTALRMIAGLEEISDGVISIGGKVVNDVPPKDRDVAMVFQNYALYPHMSVRENLEFGLRMRRTPRAEIDRRVQDAAAILGIDRLLERRPKGLSGGQRQRVAVGRAIVRKPAVFLFDEPLSNLDAKLRIQMRAEISRIQQTLGTTTIYVTHDQVEAMTMGHRIAVLKDGDLQQCGAPREVYERPANVFVAGFMGTPPMNLAPAVVAEGGASLRASGFVLPTPAAARPLLAGSDGRRIVVGVRPENVVETAKEGRGETAPVAVTVEIAEPLGHEVVVHARAGDDLLVAKLEPHRAPHYGDKLGLFIELSALHLFDADSGVRIGD